MHDNFWRLVIKWTCTIRSIAFHPKAWNNGNFIGRSSDLFRFYAFPALRPVAKIVKPFAPHVWGRNSQQRVLSQILTAFPFHSSSRNRRFGNLCDGKYTNFCLLGIFDTKKNAILYFGFFTVMNHTYLI